MNNVIFEFKIRNFALILGFEFVFEMILSRSNVTSAWT